MSKNENQKQEVEIVVKHHKQLLEILEKPKLMWRAMLMLFLVLVILFAGLTFFALVLKRHFPYSVIETNLQGATYVKNENKDVIYWLFNTADLWANSGIEVKEGDELTIRASGASYTAIHHLVDSSKINAIPYDEWVGTDGQEKKESRDKARSKYRISKTSNEGILLMQVIPAKYQNNDKDWINRKGWIQGFLTDGNIEVIGKERRNLKISQDGILHFAVNDIVLTDKVLNLMYRENLRLLCDSIDELKLDTSGIKALTDIFDSIGKGYKSRDLYRIADTLIPKDAILLDSIRKKAKRTGMELCEDPRCNKTFPLVNELVYYKEKCFRTPWYADNLGSFLIVIERKRK